MSNQVKTNIKQILRSVEDAYKKQIPFAASKALSDTANDAAKAMRAQLPKKLDRPTPFTMRAFGTRRATKHNLEAVVYIKPIQSEYLKYAIKGGRRRKNVMPVNARVNKYGNIAGLRGGRKINTLLAKPNTFKAVINGTNGVWQRTKDGKLKLLIAINQPARYTKLFPFYEIGKGVWSNRLPKNLRRSIDYAIKTAR